MQNLRKARSDNRIGLLGVCHNGKRWMALILAGGARRYLGYPRDAAESDDEEVAQRMQADIAERMKANAQWLETPTVSGA